MDPEGLLRIDRDGVLTLGVDRKPPASFFPERLEQVRLETRPSIETMRAWHREIYSPRTHPFKEQMRPVVAAFRTRSQSTEVQETCRGLQTAIETVLEDSSVLAAPDLKVEESLRDVYGRFQKMSRFCAKTRSFRSPLVEANVGSLLLQTNAALDRAASAMEPYGLRP